MLHSNSKDSLKKTIKQNNGFTFYTRKLFGQIHIPDISEYLDEEMNLP